MAKDLKSRSAPVPSQACGALLCVFVILVAFPRAHANPSIPRDDHQVLERLPGRSTAAEARELRRERAELASDPENLKTSLALARSYIQKSRAESDPRYLGFAQATLTPWWNLPQPPVEVLVLRATIRQSTHDFNAALADLDLALKADPTHAQAWLTRAIILQVRGEYEAARKACLPLFRLTSELVTVTCASSIASLNGEASQSYELLRRVYQHNLSAVSNERLWSLTVMAEIADRLGRAGEAESHFNQALALDQRDGYLLGAYADFLLDQERPREVINLLQNETRVDGLLLRLALAENALSPKPPAIQQHIESLRDRFSASRQRGDTVHRREEDVSLFISCMSQSRLCGLLLRIGPCNVSRQMRVFFWSQPWQQRIFTPSSPF